jgi:hypothetical protein
MRYVVSFVLALMASPLVARAQAGEEPMTKASSTIHAKSQAPPQLMLRASYFCDLGVDPLGGPPDPSGPASVVGFALALASVTSPLSVGAKPVQEDSLSSWQSEEPVTVTEEAQPKKGLSRGARIAIGITVPIVALGAAAGITAAVVSTNYEHGSW